MLEIVLQMLFKFAGAERAERSEASEAPFRMFFIFSLDCPGAERAEGSEASEAPLRMLFNLQNLRSPDRRKAEEVVTHEKLRKPSRMKSQNSYKR